MFAWLKHRRRRKILARPFPPEWEASIRDNFRQYELLTPEERERLRRDVQIFVAEKNWEGVYGLELTDEMRVTIAAQACYLLLGLDLSWYDRTLSILVYPDAYKVKDQFTISGGFVIEGRSHRLGENWYRGPIILSWPDVLAGGRRETRGSNLVFHEFAHELDTLNGRTADGTPPMETGGQARRWEAVTSREYGRLQRDCVGGQYTLLDCYGAESRAEFFAVATETFFQEPVRLERRHEELYAVLRDFYKQDPAARVLRRGG